MSITNYSELQTAIINWSHRADLASIIPDFITLSEAKFNRNLRTRDMEAAATITPSGGNAALPNDYLELRRLYLDTDANIELEYLTPEAFYVRYPVNPLNDADSRFFTIESGNIVLSAQSAASDLKVLYYQKIPALTVSNTTNWLLTSHPDLYLYASMAELADYTKKPDEVQKWNAKAQAVVDSLIKSDLSGKYSGSAMRVIPA